MKPGDEEHIFLVFLCLQLERQPEIDLGQDYGGIYCAEGNIFLFFFFIKYVSL